MFVFIHACKRLNVFFLYSALFSPYIVFELFYFVFTWNCCYSCDILDYCQDKMVYSRWG